MSVYASRFTKSGLIDNLQLVIIAHLAAILGAYLGNRLHKKVTLHFMQILVVIMLILMSLALVAGII